MTHNEFDFYEDLIKPIMRFLCQLNIMQSRQTIAKDTLGGTIGSLNGKLSGLTDNESSEESPVQSKDDAMKATGRKHPLSARNAGINRSISAFERKTISLMKEEETK